MHFKVFTAGARCSASGKKYEHLVNAVCVSLMPKGGSVALSTMEAEELGGCASGRFDLQINWDGSLKNINVEIKRQTPDWVQASIVPAVGLRRSPRLAAGGGEQVIAWHVKKASSCSHIFDSILAGKTLWKALPKFHYDGKKRCAADWEGERGRFPDMYIECDNDSVARAYRAKGVHYIQVHKFGLYHTGEDVCGFGVPMFSCSQRMRVRCKRHGRRCCESDNYVPSSITASLRPVFKTLRPSPLSLDDKASMLKTGMFTS
jgi:hypothetical protein